MHRGMPASLPALKQVEKLPKKDLIPSDETAFQLLWNDPSSEIENFAPSPRGGGAYLYRRKAVEEFLARNRLSGVIRSQEAVGQGYSYTFPRAEGKARLPARLLAPSHRESSKDLCSQSSQTVPTAY